MITAVMIDSREPEWVQKLNFGGVPKTVTALDTGDLWAVTDDGHTLLIERKTPDDFLGTLKDERLFPQIAKMTQGRLDQLAQGKQATIWPYLLITDELRRGIDGKVITERETGWSYTAIQGALLSIQEMGCFIAFSAGDMDYETAVLRLGKRDRKNVMQVLPARPAQILGTQAAILTSLPGIGLERVTQILDWCGNNVAYALAGITDLSIAAPVGPETRKRIRKSLGLRDRQELVTWINEAGDETLYLKEEMQCLGQR